MKYSLAIVLSSLFAFCGTLSAQVVTISVNLNAASDVDDVAMVNNGGLNGEGGRVIPNGDPELVFPITVDDSAGTGAIFEGILTLSGTVGGGGGTPNVQVTNGGTVFFSGGATRVVNFDFSGLTETTSTGATIEFDGISEVALGGASDTANADVGDDAEAGGGVDFAGGAAVNGAGAISPPVSSGPLQALVQRDTGAFVLISPTFQFTISTGMVTPTIKGDVDLSGEVNFADIPAFIGVLQAGGTQAEADTDCNGAVNFADIPAFIAILQGS